MQKFKVRVLIENASVGQSFHAEVVLGDVYAKDGDTLIKHASSLGESFVKAANGVTPANGPADDHAAG